MSEKPAGAGGASFGLIDTDKLFTELNLKHDTVFLDLACGNGAYALKASEYIEKPGIIYAIDLWEDGIKSLKEQIRIKDADIHAEVADVSKRIPLKNHSVDKCLMVVVLHDLIEDGTDKGTLKEVKRVLKDNAELFIVEFKKIEGPPGPPKRIRISPEEVEAIVREYSFSLERTMDIGSYNYLSVFKST